MAGSGRPERRTWSGVILVAVALACLLVTVASAQAAVIFSDDFESGLSGWVTTGTPDWYSGTPKDGAYSVQMAKRESLQRTISTQGYDNVTVSFSLGAQNLSKSSSRLDVTWFNGSSWVLLARLSKGDPSADGQLHPYQFTLPASAAGSSTFAFRVAFGSRARGSDRGYLDDVVISGTPRTHTVTLDKVGNGTVSVNGEVVSLPWTATLDYGTELSLQATPDPSYRFGAWTGDLAGSSNPVTLTVNGDKSIVANFLLDQVVLNLTGAGGSVSVDGVSHALPWSGIYAPGASVTLEAQAAAGHAFANWSGDAAGTANPITVALNADTNIAANFTVFRYDVTISGDGPGSAVVDGVLQTLPWTTTCDYGTELLVEAYPDDGYHFVSWSGDLTGSVNPTFVTVTGAMSFTAHFAIDSYTLSLTGSGGSVTVDGVPYALPVDVDCTSGASVEVKPVPDADMLFWGWTGDITSRSNPLTIIVDADLAVSPDFRALVVFPDVPADFWAVTQIAACYYSNVVQGYKDGNYRPKESVNRGQMAIYIARVVAGGEGLVPSGPSAPSFPDVATTSPFYKYVEYCKSQDIVQGYWDGYHPERVVTRDQMAVYIARSVGGGESGLASYAAPTTPSFPDVPVGFWAYRHIEYCRANGIVKGYWDGYHPERAVTRDQMAVYVARAFDLLP